uniref:Uncharacterized protein n=1 Tax=Arundo donax TaxID=35708 RepID=A0A0A9GKL3_ARUDO
MQGEGYASRSRDTAWSEMARKSTA